MAASDADKLVFTIIETTTKGRGLAAKTDISSGSLILSEKPLLTLYAWSRSENDHQTPHTKLLADFADLPEHKKKILLEDLYTSDTPEFRCLIFKEFGSYMNSSWKNFNRKHGENAQQVLTAFNTNAIGPHIGAKTAILNHSCVPNAYAAFEEGIGKLTVHALRDIIHGEEICISYLDGAALFQPALPQSDSSLATRREFLKLQRGFECVCDTCLEVTEWVADEYQLQDHPNEKLREELRDLIVEYRRRDSELEKNWNHINARGFDPDYIKNMIRMATGIVELISQLRLTSMEQLEWYEAIFKWNLTLRNKEAATEWQGRILDVVRMCAGKESQVLQDMSMAADEVHSQHLLGDV